MDIAAFPVQAPALQEACEPPVLSERDAHHLAALQRYWQQHRTFPSMTRLAGVLGLASAAGVFGVLRRLSDSGHLSRVDRRIAPTMRFFERQVLGEAGAGLLQLTLRDPCEALNLDEHLIDDPARTSLHRIRGDAMRDAGILDGDLAIVELRAPSQPGDFVLAVADGASIVRTLRRGESGPYFLDAANPAYAPIRPGPSLEVFGVVIGVARRVRR